MSYQPEQKVRESVLYREHLKRAKGSSMGEFAGYLMPLWYSSASEEHKAVRQRAGLFDCTHMGVLEISGEGAEKFLELTSTNYVAQLSKGKAQYGYLLDQAGDVIDDVIIYKEANERYMVVVNAANKEKVLAWFSEVAGDRSGICEVNLSAIPLIRDITDEDGEGQKRVDIALQGPKSGEILSSVMDTEGAAKVRGLKSFEFCSGIVCGVDCIISRTGYTGAKVGFEIFIAPARAAEVWLRILEAGEGAGLLPCGLASRDSLRIEAGLPLYGHELAGEREITPIEAGYGWAVKMDKGFFIGCQALAARTATSQRHVKRFRFAGGKGVRPVRGGDGILDIESVCRGVVLSAAAAGDQQVVLGLCEGDVFAVETECGIYYTARNQRARRAGRVDEVEIGDIYDADILGRVVKRFEKF
jgi:glycine hydroxymethyltransferase